MSQKPEVFETPQIYFPKLFTAVSKTVPHIELTSDAAVIDGYSFRKKRHSVKITNYHGRSHKSVVTILGKLGKEKSSTYLYPWENTQTRRKCFQRQYYAEGRI